MDKLLVSSTSPPFHPPQRLCSDLPSERKLKSNRDFALRHHTLNGAKWSALSEGALGSNFTSIHLLSELCSPSGDNLSPPNSTRSYFHQTTTTAYY